MKFIVPIKGFFASLQTVVLLAILLFSQQYSTAQNVVSLTPRNGDALFLGVDNPVQVTVAGIPSDNIFIGSDQVDIEKLDNGIFNIRASTPGKVTLTVHGEGFQYKNFDLEVKQIPDPMKKLGDPVAALKMQNGLLKTDGDITAAEFKQAVGLGAFIPKFVGDAPVGIVSYNMVYVPKVGDPVEIPLASANFNEKALGLVALASAGDRYYFQMVNASMIGEAQPKPVNSLVFKIK